MLNITKTRWTCGSGQWKVATMPLAGLHVPLITPFSADGAVDLSGLERHAHRVLDGGADGLIALGTTGEPATLTDSERIAVIDRIGGVCAERNARFTVGVGTNSTEGTADALRGIDPRADTALVVVPYYTRPSEAGVIAHYRYIAAASPVPIIVYDVPERTGRTLTLDTLLALAAIDEVIGFKHATGSISETTVRLVGEAPAGVAVLAGDDPFIATMLAIGAPGAISASANLAPQLFSDLISAWREGRIQAARRLGVTATRLAQALFAEPNPTVIKGVLAARGLIATPSVRLPLLPATAASVATAAEPVDGSRGSRPC